MNNILFKKYNNKIKDKDDEMSIEEYDELTNKILKRLLNNIPPSANQLGVPKNELIEKLYEIKAIGLIEFELYGRNHPIFKDDPDNVRLTIKGKEVAENSKVSL